MARIELSISCHDCIRQSTPDCADCLVTHVVGGTPEELTLSTQMLEVATLLQDGGLVPELRFNRVGATGRVD